MPGWKKPSITAGVLPAFAQASQGLGTGDFQATLTWNTGSTQIIDEGCSSREVRTDIDLHVWEPDGSHVYYSSRTGSTASLDIDNVCGFGPDNIYVSPGNADSGTYYVGIVNDSGTAHPTTSTIRVPFADTPGARSQTFTVITNSSDWGLLTRSPRRNSPAARSARGQDRCRQPLPIIWRPPSNTLSACVHCVG